MRKAATLMLGVAALAVAGCGDIPMVGRIGKTPFKGTIHRDAATPTGTIDLSSASGTQCIGEYEADSIRAGTADLRCDDSSFAVVHFRSTLPGQGFGVGWTDKHQLVSVVYGLPEDEASVYLKKNAKDDDEGDGDHDRAAGIYSGSGFFINERGDALTNNHVARDCTTLTARLPDGLTVPAKTIFADAINDLAVVRLETTPTVTAVFSDGSYRQGDMAVAYGFPLAGALTSDGVLTTGTISAMAGLRDDSRFVQMSTPVQPGNSGGPLADSSAHVLGVVTEQMDGVKAMKKGVLPQNINFAVKESVIKIFLQAHGVPFRQNPPDPKPLSAPEVGARLKSMVVALVCTRTGHP